MDLSRIQCKRCQSTIRPEDVNVERMFANCRVCHAVFRVAGAADAAGAFGKPTTPAPPPVGTSSPFKRWVVDRRAEGVTVRIRWVTSVGVLFAVFLVPCAWLTYANGVALLQGTVRQDIFGACVMEVIFILVTVLLAYAVVAYFVNSTWITAGRAGLKVKDHPLPFLRKADFTRHDLSQLYCKESVHKGRVSYFLMAILGDRSERTVWSSSVDASGTESAAQALFLEGELERALGIKDRVVDGEFKGALRVAKAAPAPSDGAPLSREELRRLRCRRCQSVIEPQDVNAERQFALCRICHAVFALKPSLNVSPQAARAVGEVFAQAAARGGEVVLLNAAGEPQAATPTRRRSADFDAPKRWSVLEDSGSVHIQIRWSISSALGLLIGAALFLNASWYFSKEGWSPTGVLVISGLVGFALFMLRGALKHALNTTHITADQLGILIEHKPIGWKGDGRILKRDIEQLYCVEGIRSQVRDDERRQEPFYAVHVLLKGGDSRPLIDSTVITSPEQALYLERVIEERLGIVDRPVEGEYLG
jgi:hypothetical protein